MHAGSIDLSIDDAGDFWKEINYVQSGARLWELFRTLAAEAYNRVRCQKPRCPKTACVERTCTSQHDVTGKHKIQSKHFKKRQESSKAAPIKHQNWPSSLSQPAHHSTCCQQPQGLMQLLQQTATDPCWAQHCCWC